FLRRLGSVEEKMQTWVHAAPIPPAGRRRALRGGIVFVGGETSSTALTAGGSDSRRAAGFAPNSPHFLGRARPLLEVRDRGVFGRDSRASDFGKILAGKQDFP